MTLLQTGNPDGFNGSSLLSNHGVIVGVAFKPCFFLILALEFDFDDALFCFSTLGG